MNAINIPVEVAGMVKLDAIRPDGSIRELTGWFPNIVTNTGLNNLGNGSGSISYCHVGKGTTPPVAGDTVLVSQVASTSTLVSGGSSEGVGGAAPNYYGYTRRTFQFGAGAAAGNLSEVGFSQTNASLFSRALIKDPGGNPTTITVLPDEILQVVYELRQYAPTADVPFSLTIDGVATTGFVRACNVLDGNSWSYGMLTPRTSGGNGYGATISAYSGNAVAATSAAPTGLLGNGSLGSGTFTPGTYQVDRTFSFSLTQANGTIKTITWDACGGRYQMEFTPGLVKTSSKTITGTIRLTWARRP